MFFLNKIAFCGLFFFFFPRSFRRNCFQCVSIFRVLSVFEENRLHSVGALFVVFSEKIALIRLEPLT